MDGDIDHSFVMCELMSKEALTGFGASGSKIIHFSSSFDEEFELLLLSMNHHHHLNKIIR